jgi:para-nitrobenzyl esterase
VYRRSFLTSCAATALLLGARPKRLPAGEAAPVVETFHGRIRGSGAAGVEAFRGIPFGRRVDGDGRFRAPVAAESWAGIRDCTGLGPRAMQVDLWPHDRELDLYSLGGRTGELDTQREVESENCLVLNVLTPRVGVGRRPVMVYLHGGAFLLGSGLIAAGAYGLVREQDVVLVSVNHRLNVFGYLYLGAIDDRYADSGNAGMLDLVLALKWVRENIERFGGDPGNVTIFGESGGGYKVSTLLAMPAAEGLFHRAIVESGSATYALSAEEGAQHAHRLLKTLEIGARKLGRLADIPAKKLLQAGREAGLIDPAALWPVVDGSNLPRDPFSPDAPPSASGVQMIVGHCADEDRIFSGLEDRSLFHLEDAQLQPRLAREVDLPLDSLGELIRVYRRSYPGDTPADIFFRITTDWGFGVNSTLQAERQASGGATVYKYLFTYAPPIEDRKFGAFHCAELPLVMRRVVYPESEVLSRQLAGAWASFARAGDPSQPGFAWPRYDLESRKTMLLNTESSVVDDPHREVRLAWQRMPAPRFPQSTS